MTVACALSLVGVEKKLKSEDVIKLLGTGRGVMPSFAFLSDRQKEVLADVVLGKEEASGADRTAGSSGEQGLEGIPYGFTAVNNAAEKTAATTTRRCERVVARSNRSLQPAHITRHSRPTIHPP